MRFSFRAAVLLSCLLVLCLCFSSCKEKKEGKVVITQKEFSIVRDGKWSSSVDVKGKVKNVGAVDVKKVIVTGYCRSCRETMISNTWFATQVVKSADQKATIDYLPAGAEVDFSFKGLAYYYSQTSESPQTLPDKLEVVVESFQTDE